jgi:hypothetical protein
MRLAVVAGCLAAAGLSLLIAWPPGADAWAWLIWGREVVHLDLSTTGGPSWKPLTVAGTTVLGLFGGAAPGLWLILVRAAALGSLVLAGAVVARLARGAGRAAVLAGGVLAAAGIALAPGFLNAAAQGYSEPLVVLLLLAAVERALADRWRAAWILAWGVALARPESWPFLGLFALWLWVRRPEERVWVVALLVSLPVLWYVPDWIGAGDPFYGGRRARSGGTVGIDLTVQRHALERALASVALPLWLLAAAAVGIERRRTALLAAGAVVWMAGVVVMTALGYLGIERFFLPPAAMVCVLGGAGLALLGDRMGTVPFRSAAAVALALVLVIRVPDLDGETRGLARVDALQKALPGAIDGRSFAGKVMTTAPGTDRPLAWRLHRHLKGVRLVKPGRVLVLHGSALFVPRGERWRVVAP